MSDRRRRRRRRWIIGAALIALLLVWGLFVGLKTLSAYHHDKNGLADLQKVKANSSPGDLTSSETKQLLNQAHADFIAAKSDLSSPLFGPISIVPVIGRQYTSVRDLSSAAATVSDVGSSFLTQVHAVLDLPHSAGPERVASVQKLGALSLAAEHQLSGVNPGPAQGLFSPLATKYNKFVTQLDDVRVRLTKAASVSAVVATILQGPQNYLVLAANNGEMRAGSGAFLDVGSAATSDGTVKLEGFVHSGDHILPLGAVNPTGDFARNWGWLQPGVDFRNLGLTPQFDVTAPLAARMWTSLTGEKVDGVMALDVAGLKQLMQATGPVIAGGMTISASNVEQYLLHDEYANATDSSDSASRLDALGDLTAGVLHQLEQSTDLRALAESVSSAVAGRNLMMWSSNPIAQTAWQVSGVSGQLAADSVDVSLINRGGNKLDQYMPVDVGVTTEPSGQNTKVTMTTTLDNQTPPGQSQFIAGPYPGVPVSYGGYFGLIAVNLPSAARHITMTGAGPLAVDGGEGPTWVLAAPFTLADGASNKVVVQFEMPGHHGSMTVVPSARIPAERWTAGKHTFEDTAPTNISW